MVAGDHKLVYYTSEDKADKKGEIDLTIATIRYGINTRKHQHVFSVETRARTYFFKASSRAAHDTWVKEVKRQLPPHRLLKPPLQRVISKPTITRKLDFDADASARV